MSASSSTPFAQYTKLVTTRLRSRMHGQSFINTFLNAETRKKQYSPAAKAALTRVQALLALRDEHQRGFDPTLKARAVQQLQSLPQLSTEEDPHFVVTLKALRVAAYFDAVHAPATFSLLNHLTKHSYLLDGFHMYQIANILKDLKHPRTTEVLSILLPRMRELASTDITATEACSILEVLSLYDVGQEDTVLMERLTMVMQRTIKDLELNDMITCIAGLRFVPSAPLVRPVLQAAVGRLCEMLEEAVLSLRVYTTEVFLTAAPPSSHEGRSEGANSGEKSEGDADPATMEHKRQVEKENRQLLLTNMRESRALMRELTRTCTWLGWAPRRVHNELARAVVAYTDPRPQRQAAEAAPSSSLAAADGAREEAVVFEEEEKELEQLWREMPRLTPRDIGFFLRLLSAASYRHERALLLLSSRLVASVDANSSGTEGGAVMGTRPSEAAASLSDLSTAIESLASFYMIDATATVTALVKEVVAMRARAPAFSAPQQMLITVDTLSRVILSLVRLRYPPPPPRKKDAADTIGGEPREVVLGYLEKLLTDDVFQWFAGGSACVREPLLTAQLAAGIARLAHHVGLCSSTASLAQRPPVAAATEVTITLVLIQLLEGLRRSGLDKSFSTPSTARSSQKDVSPERAEAQRSLADTVAAVKALNSPDSRLEATLQGVEAILLKLL